MTEADRRAPAMLEVAGLRAGYEDFTVLQEVSIRVPAGSIVAVIGPNGAGKSTLLKAVYGLADREAGSVRFRVDGREHDITGWRPHRLTALGLNYVPQLDNIFPALSVLENLRLGASAGPHGSARRLEAVLDTFDGLRGLLSARAGSLSGGQRQALALARALMSGPSLLLLDEPSAGLAPQAVAAVVGQLRRLREQGVTIVMVEQNARLALTMADYGYVLEAGHNRYEGPAAQLLHDERVTELYLGRGRKSEKR